MKIFGYIAHMNKKVVMEAGISSIRTMADNTIRLTLDCQEMPSDQMARVFDLKGSPGMVLISSGQISKEEIDAVDNFTTDFEITKKTPSQRLRAVLYKVWESTQPNYQLDGQKKVMPFDLFYSNQLETIITHYKQKID